ncbi:farnesol dehydrogenase-like [Chironomus tepperi]|uniref:farnesol dehydrogenase-like n=1 Tax=Chironomus tepperi TaxID=113505 RepID=UPI00391F0613
MTEKWINKIAIITGSSSGIGYAIFKQFVSHGIITIGLDVKIENTQKLIQELSSSSKVNCYAYECDISKEDSVNEVFEKIEKKFGAVHILVNNAGIGRKAEILDNDEQSLININQVIDTNFRGLLMCTRKAYHLISKTNDYGLIININSVAGHLIPFVPFSMNDEALNHPQARTPTQIFPYFISMNVYCSTKHAVTALTESIRQELFRAGNKKIRIASVSPGLVDSSFSPSSGYFENNDCLKDVPMLNPIEIAKCVMFILSTPYEVSVSEMIVRSTGEQF